MHLLGDARLVSENKSRSPNLDSYYSLYRSQRAFWAISLQTSAHFPPPHTIQKLLRRKALKLSNASCSRNHVLTSYHLSICTCCCLQSLCLCVCGGGIYVMMRLSVALVIWSYFRGSTVMTVLPSPCQNRLCFCPLG